MSGAPPITTRTPLSVLEGPERCGSEQRWRVRLADGRPALLARLLPELASDPAIRRRYVRDLERLASLGERGLAPLLERGPEPDPRDPRAAPPWRLRLDPPGITLAEWLRKRAPAPVDEVAALGAALAECLAAIHDRGVVVRDLAPRWIVIGPEGQVTLTDVGLTRVDILSTRTAASLLVESSPYASPEQLAKTVVDPRSDLFGLGVILYQALTGALPFGDGPALLRDDQPPPPPSELRAEVPAAFDEVIRRCLARDPEGRPATAREVAAILRGRAAPSQAIARVVCQSCGAPLRLGQRLCLSCGKEAVLFEHMPEGSGERYSLDLTKASEDTAFSQRLQRVLDALARERVPVLNLVIGDARMYSKQELARRYRLPLRLFDDLSQPTAEALQARLAAEGITTRVRRSDGVDRRQRRITLAVTGGAMLAVLVPLALIGGAPVLGIGLAISLVVFAIIAVSLSRRRRTPRVPLIHLRPAPAALPASDPLVTRMAALLQRGPAADVREQIAELALLVQRLVDHRATIVGERAELDRILEPIAPLVGLIEEQVAHLEAIDRELQGLDEGAIVRGLAASEARGEPASAREELLLGLDRLRALEDQRAQALHRLLSAGDLLRRSADLGLAVHDPEEGHRRQIALALHALGGEVDGPQP
ncbi:MAG: protein kinase [Myxococcales bacterium]|nr:protein kinase [Myxococcales bacterium]